MRFLELLWNVNVLEMTSDFIFSIASKSTQITFELLDHQMFLSYVECQLIVASHGFPAVGTNSFISLVFSLRRVNVLNMSDDVKSCVGRVVAVFTMMILNLCVHSFNVKFNFALLSKAFATQRASVARMKKVSDSR